MYKPLVSVCIPTYNGEKFLKEALVSVQQQSYENLEVIFSDDDSSDRTMEIIKDFQKETKFPVQVHQHQPSGIGENWNNCVKNSKGRYIKFLFQDDVLFPNCIEKLVSLAIQDDMVGLVYCKRKFIYNKRNKVEKKWINDYSILHTHWKNLEIKEGILSGKKYLRDPKIFNFPENKIGEPTAVLIHKKCFKKVGYFSCEFKQALDIEFWSRVLKYYNIGFVDEPLVYFRIHEGQASQINQKNGVNELNQLHESYYKSLLFYVHPLVAWKLVRKFKANKIQILSWLKRLVKC